MIIAFIFRIKQGWRNKLSVLFICCSGQVTFTSWIVRGQVKQILYLGVYFQMIAAEIDSLQTFSILFQKIWIIVKVLQNVTYESCS